jgi:hypothetical protein
MHEPKRTKLASEALLLFSHHWHGKGNLCTCAHISLPDVAVEGAMKI